MATMICSIRIGIKDLTLISWLYCIVADHIAIPLGSALPPPPHPYQLNPSTAKLNEASFLGLTGKIVWPLTDQS